MGPAHGGFEFLKGNFTRIEGYDVGRMTKSRRGKLYIDELVGAPRPAPSSTGTGPLRWD